MKFRFFKTIPFLFLFPGTLFISFSFPTLCKADLPKDADIRKFIQDTAASDKDSSCKDLQISADNSDGVSLVNEGIKTLGGKTIDDITRTNYQYNWTNGTENLETTYHIRSGKEGFYFYLSMASENKKPPSVDMAFEKAEANPWEVDAINFTCKHWVLLLIGLLVAGFLLIMLVIWMIRRFLDKPSHPPRVPVA